MGNKSSSAEAGVLVVSLDFELYWGMRDHVRLDDYLLNLLGVYDVVPSLLSIFSAYDIHATWAIVGLLACSNAKEVLSRIPRIIPIYDSEGLSPYLYLRGLDVEENEPALFAPTLVQMIVDAHNQEIATHTFSHYYCREEGQTTEAFYHDIEAAIELLRNKYGIGPRSIVFPRNQYSREHLQTCNELGLLAYRGTGKLWWDAPRSHKEESSLQRLLRLTDSYINISGHHCYDHAAKHNIIPIDIPASRLLRPSPRSSLLERIQKRRIMGEMHHAARFGKLYHLWWHPHNFGARLSENLCLLNDILDYFSQLRSTYGMLSMNMEEYAEFMLGS